MSELIVDPLGREWWNQKFKGARQVDLVDFCKVIEERFGNESITKLQLVVGLVIDVDGNDSVKAQEFSNFLLRFGPFDQCITNVNTNLFDENGAFYPWYHGATARDEAGTLLGKSRATSSFLIRFSDSKPDKLALAYTRVKEGKVEVKNMLIDCIPAKDGGGFIIPNFTQKADTLVQLVAAYNEHLKHPIPHTKEFEARVALITKHGYEKLRKGDCKKELEALRPQGNGNYGPITAEGEHKGSGNYSSISGGNDHAQPSGNYAPIHTPAQPQAHSGGAYAPIDVSGSKPHEQPKSGGAYAPIDPHSH